MKKESKSLSLETLSGYISYILAAVWLLLGLVLAIWPSASTGLICFLVGCILILCGIFTLLWNCRKLAKQADYPYSLELSAVFLAIGIWILMNPKVFLTIIPILCGVLFLIHGVVDGLKSWKLKKREQRYWWSGLAIGGILIILGAVLLINPFKEIVSAIRYIGIVLIFNSLTDFWLCFCLSFAGRHSLLAPDILDDLDDDDAGEEK